MLSHHKPHRPAFSSTVHQKLVNTPNTTRIRRTISILNRHFGRNTMAHTTHTQWVNMGDGNSNCGNITGSFNTTFCESDQDAHIMRWLSPLEPNTRHQAVRTGRFGSVGDWFLETSEFRRWSGGEREGGVDKAVLFCSGNPGVGKTYLR